MKKGIRPKVRQAHTPGKGRQPRFAIEVAQDVLSGLPLSRAIARFYASHYPNRNLDKDWLGLFFPCDRCKADGWVSGVDPYPPDPLLEPVPPKDDDGER